MYILGNFNQENLGSVLSGKIIRRFDHFFMQFVKVKLVGMGKGTVRHFIQFSLSLLSLLLFLFATLHIGCFFFLPFAFGPCALAGCAVG